MEKISWKDKVTNEQVLEIVKEKEDANGRNKKKKSRKKKWIGDVLRENGLLKETIEGRIEGRIEGKRPRGRRRGHERKERASCRDERKST